MNKLFVSRPVKWILLAGLLVVFITGLAFSPAVDTRSGSDTDPQLNHPLLQATDYPPETALPTNDPYPAGTPSPTITNTAAPGSTQVQPSDTPGGPTATLTITITPADTATPPPNVFQTEDSEMGGSQATPPASETPVQTAAGTATQFLTPTVSMTRSAPFETPDKQNGFRVNWGLFWMGFALPFVAACGVVLYLLDRRPDLFRPKHSTKP